MRIAVLFALALLLTACGKFYWTRPGATYDDFAAEHRECLEKGGFPVKDRPGYVVIPEANLKSCLLAKGWTRVQWQAVRADEVRPANLYRGLEDFDPEPIAVDTMPEPRPAPQKK
jgi:hypothetical protein